MPDAPYLLAPRRAAVWLTGLLVIVASVAYWPGPPVDGVPGGIKPDGYDYVYGAAALLHGQYEVDWEGVARPPHYPPGMSFILTPFVALGGFSSTVWVPYAASLLTGVLAAIVAGRLGRPLAAPLAAGIVYLSPPIAYFSGVVMSDVPTAVIGLLAVLLLSSSSRQRTLFAAGPALGLLPWFRSANLILCLVGPIVVLSLPTLRPGGRWHLLGICMPIALIGVWQWSMFGSFLTTGYGASATAWDGGDSMVPMFSVGYLFGPAPTMGIVEMSGRLTARDFPNLVTYVLQLLGLDGYLTPLGLGVTGIVTLVRMVPRTDSSAVIARFCFIVLLLSLAIYVPYYYQSARFLLLPATLLNAAAAAFLVELIWRGTAWLLPNPAAWRELRSRARARLLAERT